MFDLAKAKQMALACELSYGGDSDAIVKALKLKTIHTKSVGDFFGFLGEMEDGKLLLVFRGTATLGGWCADFNTKLTQTKEFPGLVHSGFYGAFMDFLPWLQTHSLSGKNLEVGSHSLGGSLGVLVSHMFNAPVYTFGCPMVGDVEFAKGYKNEHNRVVNDLDPVPYLPVGSYCHTGVEYRLPECGSPSSWRPLISLLTHLWNGFEYTIVSAIQDHYITSYQQALRNKS